MTAHHPKVLVVGESVVDVIENPAGTSAHHPGGSPANVAYGLGLLGQDTTLLTQLGDDENGDLLRRHLNAGNVTLLNTPTIPRTATSTAVLDRDGGATYHFDIEWSLAPVQLPSVPGHIHTGSLATVMSPGAETIHAMLREYRNKTTISFDPNVRPALYASPADAVARTERLVALSDVVKASNEDLAWLYPDATVEQIVGRWLNTGATLVVVTMGASGSIVAAHGLRFTLPATPASVVDTVGAGDSYMAALLDTMIQFNLLGAGGRESLRNAGDTQLRQIAERASMAASITVSRAGANPPTAEELSAAMA